MFGERLARLRKEKKLSQYELADRLNFSRGQIANYEQGQRQPDYETLQKLADFFDVSLDYLLGRTDNPNPPDKKEPSTPYTAPLTAKDERDIAKRLEEIKKDM